MDRIFKAASALLMAALLILGAVAVSFAAHEESADLFAASMALPHPAAAGPALLDRWGLVAKIGLGAADLPGSFQLGAVDHRSSCGKVVQPAFEPFAPMRLAPKIPLNLLQSVLII
ncbi:MAG TPA: hypothetical protein VNN77_03455 [candidate division Zixibacteria bacterium]|nr:hypothetical protein [candidate division Zixibacteria bacterium]